MSTAPISQNRLLIGVDVGGTFTDLVASAADGRLIVAKVPSTAPEFHLGVIQAIHTMLAMPGAASAANAPTTIVHGSTVATNALLQRTGSPIAFITTHGFADMLLIGRQNRPRLYALNVHRPPPIAPPQHCFTVPERIAADGTIVQPLDETAASDTLRQIQALQLRHVAICLLFSFINPAHEQRLGQLCREAGLTATLSSDLLPEFREYERASTTAINASLRPTVEAYLSRLEGSLPSAIGNPQSAIRDLRIMHSSGGTLPPSRAAEQAARMLLSGPAGGILGAAHVARLTGFQDVITCDMGGTSTDVATILGGQPQWTTGAVIDGLPVALPMFDIHTIGAGGGSVAFLDPGGALRVGPRSAGAVPGPACYDRGGAEPTVTDANLLLGRIPHDSRFGGDLKLRVDLARRAIEPLSRQINRSIADTAQSILTVVESNMQAAIRAVTSRRGHDPRQFTLVSFGGAGGLHACAIAQALDIPRVLIPRCAGVLSALGMVVAPPLADASRTILHLHDQLDDPRIAAEFGLLSGQTMQSIPYDQTSAVKPFADVRFRGQSHELQVPVLRPSLEHIHEQFRAAYQRLYGRLPGDRPIEIVTLRIRRIGRTHDLELPALQPGIPAAPPPDPPQPSPPPPRLCRLMTAAGVEADVPAYDRLALLQIGPVPGPALLLDPDATAYLPPSWSAAAPQDGSVILQPIPPPASL